MQKLGIPLLAGLLVMAGGPGRSQDATPSAPGSTIRVTTTEVALDLVVRNKKGRQVKNLKPGDVEIYEDGVRQQVLSFRLVPGREEQRREAANPTAGSGAATSRPLREVNTVCIVFHNIDPVTRPHAIEIVKEFIKSDLPPETYIGIFNLNETLIPIHAFTKNRAELLQSGFDGKPLDFGRASEALLTASPNIVTVNAQVNSASHTASVSVDTTGGEVSNNVIMGADVSNSTGANRLRGDQVRERSDFANITGMHETDRIITLINQLGTLPGRKSVLLVTTGLTTTGDPDRFQKILDNANSHGITFYALDSTEMSPDTDTAQGGKLAVAQMASVSQNQSNKSASASVMRQNSKQGDDTISAVRTSDTQSSLRQLSEGTGGFLIANTNDFRKSFQQFVENLDAHYEVVYRPASAKYDGRLRKVEVKLARNDLEVDSRTGYFAMPDLKGSGPLTPVESTGLAVLSAQPRPHAFSFHVTGYHFQSAGSNSRGTLAFELPSSKLGATADPARKAHKFEVSLFALIRDADGQVVDKYSLDMPYLIADARLAAVRADDLTYTHPVDLPPGHYTVDTAVVDREGGQATAETAEIDIPAPSKGVGISSLVAVEHLEPANAQADSADPLTFKGKHVIPMVAATVSPAAKRYIYFVVYPDKTNAEKPQIHVEFKTGGQVFAQSTADLPAADATGTIPMFVAAATRPGNCELQITALQGKESATERLQYAVVAK
ncbi:MAG TPA: VWA domain-containing protein [Bryobacteraceae bacterium]|jgi:VWFA-related protein|nr:VWA domain-containing protein [Bryobacteraceae bacterium]